MLLLRYIFGFGGRKGVVQILRCEPFFFFLPSLFLDSLFKRTYVKRALEL